MLLHVNYKIKNCKKTNSKKVLTRDYCEQLYVSVSENIDETETLLEK